MQLTTERRLAFEHEMALGRQFIAVGELVRAFQHLERAHVLGQAFVMPHARAHWQMLMLEIRRRCWAAAFGQMLRIVLGTLGSAVGLVPVGNTGGTNVSMFKRLPIDPDLQQIIDGTSSSEVGGS